MDFVIVFISYINEGLDVIFDKNDFFFKVNSPFSLTSIQVLCHFISSNLSKYIAAGWLCVNKSHPTTISYISISIIPRNARLTFVNIHMIQLG